VTDATELRPLMFSVAYGMLGSVAEAEDVAQEAQLRMLRETADIRSPAAYAVTVTTRLAIDELRSARARREVYVGAWLPEPLVSNDPAGDPSQRAEAAEQLSIALLVMLERLSPVERAVFLLREVFQYEYERIAEIVERSAENCRQILTRARAHVRADQPRFEASPERHGALVDRFLAAAGSGDLAGLEAVLADDIAVTGDGGGKVPALATPVQGRLRVARFVIGLFRQVDRFGARIERIAEIVERSAANCRQILTRARAHVRADQPRFEASPERHGAVVDRFLAAAGSGDLAGLEAVLADDIAVTGDGGGKVPALATPVQGRLRVARFVIGLFRQVDRFGARVERVVVNGQPGGRAIGPDGEILSVFALDIVDDRVVAVYNILNPDKLTRV